MRKIVLVGRGFHGPCMSMLLFLGGGRQEGACHPRKQFLLRECRCPDVETHVLPTCPEQLTRARGIGVFSALKKGKANKEH